MAKKTSAAVPASNCIVVIGASAGGIEALTALVSTLDKTFAAPIVIAQHLEPNRPTTLPQLLERRCVLPVSGLNEDTALEPGHVYVIPPGNHGHVTAGRIRLESSESHRPRPSIDLLFSTAASAYGEHCFGVILTGSGHDGVAGAIEIKERGGTVVIQNPLTARFPSMPLALPPTAVDHEADIERIGPLLHDLLHAAAREDTDQRDDALRTLLATLSRKTGVDFSQYKQTTLLRRIGRRMAMTYIHTLRDYASYVETQPTEAHDLVRSILIKVTAFFRDAEAFAFLKKSVLPGLIEEARARGKVLRVWSAGCSTGEEAYSIAFLLAEMLGPELREWSVKIFATDLEDSAIQFARRGLYPATVLQKLPPGYLARYFEAADGGYRVTKTIRQLVIFGQQDLNRGVPFPRIDLAVCRNLLIYFKPELQQAVLDVLAYSLAPTRGVLFLGKAETVHPSRACFDLVNKRWKVYRCRYEGAAQAPRPTPRAAVQAGRRGAPPIMVSREGGGEADVMHLRRLNESVLKHLPNGVALIDVHYKTIVMNPAARRLLGIRDVGVEQDFLHAIHGLPYKDMRTLIDGVLRERTGGEVREIELTDNGAPGRMFVTIAASYVQFEPGGGDYVMLNIADVTDEVQYRRQLRAVQAEQDQLVSELGNANQRLVQANKDLQDANEELQSSNEELMLAHEELQAINEEFEATNEELQSSNEELETNNEELQATNEELEATNEELNARSLELQEAAKRVSEERFRFAEMIALAPYSTLVVRTAQLRIEHLNARFEELLGRSDVVGRPLDEVGEAGPLRALVDMAQRAYAEDRTIVDGPVEQADADGLKPRWLQYTAVPTHRGGGEVDGVALYAEDVSEAVARRDRERGDYLKIMIENARQVAMGLYDGGDRTLVQANRRYRELLQQLGRPAAKGSVIGRRWPDLAFSCGSVAVDEVLERAAKSGVFVCPEPLRVGEGEAQTWWEWAVSSIPAEGDRAPQFYVFCAVEVTAQARAREALERMDRHKDEFLSLASHELRTPLVPLIAYSDMVEQLLKQKPNEWERRLREHVARFRSELQRLARLTEDLIDVARVQSGKLSLTRERIDLREAVRQSVEDARLAKGVDIRVQTPDAPLLVHADAHRIAQVVGNLVDNAVKFGAGQPVRVKLAAKDGAAIVEIVDKGGGIPPQHLPHIFDRFYQADRPRSNGLGLGLYISRSIVESHGGEIAVDSKPGKGTVFRVRIPLAPAGKAARRGK